MISNHQQQKKRYLVRQWINNIYFDRNRTDLADNVRLVSRIANIARDMGREPATPEEARRIMGLPSLRN